MDEAMVKARENLWLLGANIDLVGAESELVSVVGREIILREALEQVKNNFDFIIIDCPPSLGLLALNALAARVRYSFRSSPISWRFRALANCLKR